MCYNKFGDYMNQDKFNELRIKYPNFIYDSYKIEDTGDILKFSYKFIIEDLITFTPYYEIEKKYITNENINKDILEYLIFHIGLIELISYFKCTCSPNVKINAGYIDKNQINWFKKLYYYGLGEMLYTNGINVELDELMNITCDCKEQVMPNIDYKGIGNLIPVGGGKDSCVTLELMKNELSINTPIVMNPKDIHYDCVKCAGYNDLFRYKRVLDKKIIELNNKGFLNGHTPFSSLVAFTTYLCAYLSGKKYIILSNENSANEPTVLGTKINHQYSKSYEFECDFNNYTSNYFNIDIKYFSLLRPLNEFTIGMLFSKYKKYHKLFKSCNLGSKSTPWVWCCECPKCLFVYIILSPYINKKEIIEIFGTDLYEKEILLKTFKELLGYAETKPFECVGMYNEVRYAVSLVINKYEGELPYLLKYYKENYPLELDHKFECDYNKENNLEEKFDSLLKKEVNKYV